MTDNKSKVFLISVLCLLFFGVQSVSAADSPTGDLPIYKIGDVELPAQVPYLNKKHRFSIGNGVMMAVGDANGAWSHLGGPGYSTSDWVISSEAISLEVDGVDQKLEMDIHRAERTGIYYGVKTYGDLMVHLIDCSPWGKPYISRVILIDNISHTASHEVRVKAVVSPRIDRNKNTFGDWTMVKDSTGADCAFSVKLDAIRTQKHKHCTLIAFSDPAAIATSPEGNFELTTSVAKIDADATYKVALYHYGYTEAQSDDEELAALRGSDFSKDLEAGIIAWRAWYENVGDNYKLEKITDPRARELVEGGLAILKTNQSQDGGMLADIPSYTQGYIRDAALGMRGFEATGHFEELSRWIQWMQARFESIKHIPNNAICESSLNDQGWHEDYNSAVEVTALSMLVARDYYRGTGDLKTLTNANGYLESAMDTQLKAAVANNYKMDFNGDETELCRAVAVEASGILPARGSGAYWSMSSVALCAASLDFYIQYLTKKGADPALYHNSLTHTVMNLPVELENLKEAMDRDYWRIDVPEIPDGFHDIFRKKTDDSWPLKRIVNFSLFPVYFSTPYKEPDRRAKDVAAMGHYFNSSTGFLQLVPGDDQGFDGHTLGYLLWGLLEVGDPKAQDVYKALVNGPLADCWGSFSEAYSAKGGPNSHDLRTFETGCNLSAIAKYWQLGVLK